MHNIGSLTITITSGAHVFAVWLHFMPTERARSFGSRIYTDEKVTLTVLMFVSMFVPINTDWSRDKEYIHFVIFHKLTQNAGDIVTATR